MIECEDIKCTDPSHKPEIPCDAFQCSKYNCIHSSHNQCKEYECLKYTESQGGNMIECEKYQCKDKSLKTENDCKIFECSDYECINPLKHQCKEFKCDKYAIPQDPMMMECEDIKCKNGPCNAFKCSNYTCIHPSRTKCKEFECQQYAKAPIGKVIECEKYQCKDKSLNTENDCNAFQCSNYECINPSQAKCKEFLCEKYAIHQPQDYIECTEIKCKNKTNSSNQCKRNVTQETCVKYGFKNTNPSYFKPNCTRKERICTKYEASVDNEAQCKHSTCLDDEGNNYFKPQCKRMKAKCMKYEAVIADSKTHSQPNCLSLIWECLEYEPDIGNTNSSGTKCQKWGCLEYGNALDNDNAYPKPKCKKWDSMCKEYAPAIDDGNMYQKPECTKWEKTHTCVDEQNLCIPKAWKCDGDEDCPNGKDERPEICGMYQLLTYRNEKYDISYIFQNINT